MDNETIVTGYRRFACWYDVVYGPILQPGRRAAVRALDFKPGDRVLEVGVGTGLSLPLYPKSVHVTGIDISHEMLAKARVRAARQRLDTMEALLEMDGQHMGFPDDSFDAVLVMYVISVVSDPLVLMEEVGRVCRPEGRIVIVNHFTTRNPLIRAYDKLLKPLHRLVSHRSDLELGEFIEQAHLKVSSQTRTNIFHYSTVLTCGNRD